MKNNIKILGTNGTKGMFGGTTAFQIDKANMIDAGNLVVPLGDSTCDIQKIWLTHSHLDHIEDIAYILDSYFHCRKQSLRVCGLQETIEALQKHFLNDIIWPDFSKIKLPGFDEMALAYEVIIPDKEYAISENMTIEAFKTDHIAGSCGYIIKKDGRSLLITSDTYSLDSAIAKINSNPTITALVVECSFPSKMARLAKDSKHLTPELLFNGIKPVEERGLQLYVNHIKPLCEEVIREEIGVMKGKWEVEILKDSEIIYF